MHAGQPHVRAPIWARELLKETKVARFATVDRKGRPLVVPINYAFDGENCYTAVDFKPKRTRNLRRLRNLDENPQVSLVVDHYEEDWEALRHVIVEGRGEVLTSGKDFTHAILLLVEKYLQYQALGLDRQAVTIIKIIPQRIHTWRYDEQSGELEL